MGIYDIKILRIVLPGDKPAAGARSAASRAAVYRHPWTREKSPSNRYRWGREESGLIPVERWREKYGRAKSPADS